MANDGNSSVGYLTITPRRASAPDFGRAFHFGRLFELSASRPVAGNSGQKPRPDRIKRARRLLGPGGLARPVFQLSGHGPAGGIWAPLPSGIGLHAGDSD